jgi:16S rRNA processing protein RimM
VPAPEGGGASPPALLEVGHVMKPHGLRGEVVVRLVTDRVERLATGSVLHTEHGDLVVRTARPHHARWLVTFEGLGTREAAEALRGVALRAEPLDEPDELWVHELVGSEVVTVDGQVAGRCVAVVANPASDLIELDDGALVPVAFVVAHEGARVTIDPPEGLFDL